MARRWAAFVAAVALGLGPVLLISTSPASAAGSAIDQLGACMAGGGKADVLLVLDTSASLKEGSHGHPATDPNDVRVKAARFFVDQLAATVKDTNAHVDVALAGFADKFTPYGGWHDVREGSAALDQGLDQFADRDNGFETDYWNAADGARSYLDKKAGNNENQCKAWVWFSDGIYELDGRSTSSQRHDFGEKKQYGPDVKLTDANKDAIRDAGAADLCRVGGVADQLRTDNVITLAVGLNAGGNTDFDLMKRVATGQGSTACGRTGGTSPGEFILADRIGDLYVAFDRLADPTNEGTVQRHPVCQGDVCPSGKHTFVLDASINKVHIVGSAGLQKFDTLLISPSGKRSLLGATGEESFSSASWSASAGHLSADAVQINLTEKSDADWSGEWSVVFVDRDHQGPAMSQSNIRLYGDLKPALVSKDDAPIAKGDFGLTTGEKTKLGLGLVNGIGDPVNPDKILSKVSLTASVVYPDGTIVPITSAPLEGSAINDAVTVDLEKAEPGNANLQLSLTVTTRNPKGGDGTTLEPQSVNVPVVITPPAQYPKVPNHVSFGRTDKAGTFQSSLKLTGAGCAWVEDSAPLTLPDGIKDLKVASSANAQSACSPGSVPLELTVGQAGAGLASGTLTVMTLPKDTTQPPVAVKVRYELEMERHRNDKLFWIYTALITAAGIALPVLLLYLVKWSTAKFPASSLALGSLKGPVGPESSFLTSASITHQDLRGIVLAGTDRRTIALNGLATIRARMGLGLTEPSYAVVSEQVSVSSANPSTTRTGRHARMPLSVQDRWIALLDPNDPHHGPVEVVFVVAPAAGKLSELLMDARNRVPEAVAKVRARLGDAPAAPPGSGGTDDWGAPPAPPAGGAPASGGWDDWGSTPTSGPSAGPTAGSTPTAPGGGLDDW
jgi:hypothetical protein